MISKCQKPARQHDGYSEGVDMAHKQVRESKPDFVNKNSRGCRIDDGESLSEYLLVI